MSYNEIEYTLRSLGVSNNTSPVEISPTHFVQHSATQQTSPTKQPKTTTTTLDKLEPTRLKTLPDQKIAVSLKHIDRQYKNNPLSASSKSERSFTNSNSKRLIGKVENDSRSVSRQPGQRVCQYCHSRTNSDYYDNTNKNRIDDLEYKIKQLEKQIQQKNYTPISIKNLRPQYYDSESQKQNNNEQRKFIHRCVEMTQKFTKVENPSLKFCWKFIKQYTQDPKSQYLSSRKELLSPGKQSKKSQIVITDLKSMLHVKHRSDISKAVASMIINLEIFQRIYQKVKKLLNVNPDSPSLLLHYLQTKDRKSKKEERD